MAKRNPQMNFFDALKARSRKEHGGSITHGKRKARRPLDKNKGVHVVMRASQARKGLSFRSSSQRARDINEIIREKAKRFGIKIEQIGNAGNHIHLLIRFQTRKGFQNFLRAITGLIARLVTKAQRGKGFGTKFWDQLAYSRVVERGRDFFAVKQYVELNDIEGAGGPMARAKQADIWAASRRRAARQQRAAEQKRSEARQ